MFELERSLFEASWEFGPTETLTHVGLMTLLTLANPFRRVRSWVLGQITSIHEVPKLSPKP